MRYQNNDLLREYLDRGAAGAYREHLRHPGFELDDDAFAAALAAVRCQHPDLSDDEAAARAAFRLLTTGTPPRVAVPLPSRWYRARAWCVRHAPIAARVIELLWAAALLILALAAVIMLSALTGRAEPPPDPVNVVSANDAVRALLLRPPALLPQLAGGSVAARVQFLNGSAWTSVSSSNPLPMTCISGCSGGGGGGTSAADEAAFTEGTTTFTPSGGYYKSSFAALSSGQGGAVALTANRAFHVTLYGSGGTEITTLPVSGTFWQTTQPVSLASLPALATGSNTIGAVTQSGAWTVQPGNTANTTPWLVTLNDGAGHSTPAGDASARSIHTTVDNASLAVTGTFWQSTQPVSLASLPALATGSNTIGSVKHTDGTNTAVIDPCAGQTKSFASISQTANTRIVTGTASKKIYVCDMHVVVAAATNVALVEGTGSTCGTGTAGVQGFGGATAATGWNFAASGGIAIGNGSSAIGAQGTAADDLCVFNSGSGQVSGGISYVVQ